MKAATVNQLKQELKHRPDEELLKLCLRLARFKKENKELLTYLLFESENEAGYVSGIKELVDEQFDDINTKSSYWVTKQVRKIQRGIKKHIRYSGVKETEVELLLYFCFKLKNYSPYINRITVLRNILGRQIEVVAKKITGLHEDLQYDYQRELDAL